MTKLNQGFLKILLIFVGVAVSTSDATCSSSDKISAVSHANKMIAFHDENIIQDVADVEDCKKLCLDALAFPCCSIEYNYKIKECHLSKFQQADVKDYFVSTQAPWQYVDWNCRPCGQPKRNHSLPEKLNVTLITHFTTNDDTYRCQISDSNLHISPRIYKKNYIWLFDGKIIDGYTSTDRTLQNTLPDFFANKVERGTKLRCAVSACYMRYCKQYHLVIGWSVEFIADIQVVKNNQNLLLYEGHTGEQLQIFLPVPPHVLGRTSLQGDPLTWKVLLDIKTGISDNAMECPDNKILHQVVTRWHSKDQTINQLKCQAEINESNWRLPHTVIVKALSDNKLDGDKSGNIRISASIKSETASHIVYVVQEKFSIIDRDTTAICMLMTHSHITTFDGSFYNNFMEGEFILYKHKTLPFEVRTFTRSSEGRASCNCAVAIKVYDDVFLVDKCVLYKQTNVSYVPLTFKMYGSKTPAFKIYSENHGKKLQVILPTATLVIIRPTIIKNYNSTCINVWVKASAADYNSTLGLCGTLDNNRDNDYMMRDGTLYKGGQLNPTNFYRSWLVDPKNTIYNGFCPETVQPSELEERENNYCLCNDEPSRCVVLNDLQFCSFELKGDDMTRNFIERAIRPPKCSGQHQNSDPIFRYDSKYVPKIYSWPTAQKGLKKNYIENKCSFQYRFLSTCQKYTGVFYDYAFRSCVEDIQMTEDIEWALALGESIKEQCQLVLNRNLSLWVKPEGPPKSITNYFCPTVNCQGKGSCKNGACICNAHYGGLDCSWDTLKNPVLLSLENEFCDRRHMACHSFTLYGYNFGSTQTLNCIYGSAEGTRDIYQKRPRYLLYNIIECPSEDVALGKYTLALKKSGNTRISKIVTITNTNCFDCDSNKKCTLKPQFTTSNIGKLKDSYCYINNKCYEPKENAENNRDICDPETSVTAWTADPCKGSNLWWWWYRKSEIVSDGFEGKMISNKTLKQCKEACLSSQKYICLSFNYNSEKRNCILNEKSQKHGRPRQTNSFNDAYYEWKCEQKKTDPCKDSNLKWDRSSRNVLGGFERWTTSSITLKQCREACLSSQDYICLSIYYNRREGNCTLNEKGQKHRSLRETNSFNDVYYEWECKQTQRNPVNGGASTLRRGFLVLVLFKSPFYTFPQYFISICQLFFLVHYQ